MQLSDKTSYVVTDPKGTIVVECGKMLVNHGYTLKILNTINFSKSFHYNPFHYIRSEKSILVSCGARLPRSILPSFVRS